MNSIPQVQDTPAKQRLLQARKRAYDEAEAFQIAQIFVTVLLPLMGAVVGLVVPAYRPAIGALAVAAALIDIALLDRLQRERLKLAARLSELFDCEVLELPWNDFVVGKRPDAEVIQAKAAGFRGDATKLLGWYKPKEIGLAPLGLARIICQRENLWYNSSLRRRAGATLVVITLMLVGSLWVLGLLAQVSVQDFVITFVTPAAPVLIWSLREYYRQRDTAEALDQIKGAAEAIWDRAVGPGCDASECAIRSREFQDAIYLRRATSPLPVPLLYRFLRARMEAEMSAGAADRLRQIGIDVRNASAGRHP